MADPIPPLQLEVFPSPPMFLYHYTGQEGLFGIMRTTSIWATKIKFLNDSSEFKHACRLANALVLSEVPNGIEAPELLQRAVANRIEGAGCNVFVSSWSEMGDQLSQWRAYSRGAQGYALRVSGGALWEVAKHSDFLLGRCVYDEGMQLQFLRTIVANYWKQYALADTDNRDKVADGVAGLLVQSLLHIGPFLKHRGFAEEREWRLVSKPLLTTDSRISVRLGKLCPVPYIAIPLAWDGGGVGQVEFLVGPGPMGQEASEAVRILGRESRLNVGAKIFSQTPLRDI